MHLIFGTSLTLFYFCYRMVANLTDDSGLLKATTSKGAAATGVIKKLVLMSEQKDKFVKELDS